MKYWKAFKNDKKIENFFLMKEDFSKMRLEKDYRWEIIITKNHNIMS